MIQHLQYELDLLKEMSGQRKGDQIMVVCNTPSELAKSLANYYYSFDTSAKDNIFVGLDFIIVAQMMGLFASIRNHFTPDDPCPTGEVNRVVKGVTLYPYKK